MDWPINVLFLALGALLTWITPPALKSTWVRVVGICIGRYARLLVTLKGPLHKRMAHVTMRWFYFLTGNILYPRRFVTESRDADIQRAIRRGEEEALYRRQPWARRFDVIVARSVPSSPPPEHLR